jgi:hypothetical protein
MEEKQTGETSSTHGADLNVFKILVLEHDYSKILRRYRCRLEDNIKLYSMYLADNQEGIFRALQKTSVFKKN